MAEKSPRVITIVRHGATNLNESEELRGWANVPLNKAGLQQAERCAAHLKECKIDCLLSSDMDRARKTAEIIAERTGIPLEKKSAAFRPWHLGVLTGQSVAKTLPVIAHYVTHVPMIPIPQGESFNTFRQRFLRGLHQALADHPKAHLAIVTHHRGERLLCAWDKAGQKDDGAIDISTFLQKGIDPGECWDITIFTP